MAGSKKSRRVKAGSKKPKHGKATPPQKRRKRKDPKRVAAGKKSWETRRKREAELSDEYGRAQCLDAFVAAIEEGNEVQVERKFVDVIDEGEFYEEHNYEAEFSFGQPDLKLMVGPLERAARALYDCGYRYRAMLMIRLYNIRYNDEMGYRTITSRNIRATFLRASKAGRTAIRNDIDKRLRGKNADMYDAVVTGLAIRVSLHDIDRKARREKTERRKGKTV